MPSIKVSKNKRNPYFLMDKRIFNDKRLSIDAMGIMCIITSKPDDWNFNFNDILSSVTDDYETVKSAVDELVAAGYLTDTSLNI